jgi:hypothetical protein
MEAGEAPFGFRGVRHTGDVDVLVSLLMAGFSMRGGCTRHGRLDRLGLKGFAVDSVLSSTITALRRGGEPRALTGETCSRLATDGRSEFPVACPGAANGCARPHRVVIRGH